jgi:hypothetical protein
MTSAAILLAPLLLVVLIGLPVVLMITATRGGPHLAWIVRAVVGAAIVVAAFVALLTLLDLSGDTTTVTVPISQMPVKVPSGVTLDGLRATISDGGFDRVTVTAAGLSVGARWTAAASVLLAMATAIVVAFVVLRLVRSTQEGDPFALGSRALIRTGLVVLVGGTASVWVGDVGDWLASRELFGTGGWSGVDVGADVTSLSQLGWPEPAAFRLDLPWAPLAVAVVLALLAAVFRQGARLRADTEGLV